MSSKRKIHGKIKGNAYGQIQTVKNFIAVRSFYSENKTPLFVNKMSEVIIGFIAAIGNKNSRLIVRKTLEHGDKISRFVNGIAKGKDSINILFFAKVIKGGKMDKITASGIGDILNKGRGVRRIVRTSDSAAVTGNEPVTMETL